LSAAIQLLPEEGARKLLKASVEAPYDFEVALPLA